MPERSISPERQILAFFTWLAERYGDDKWTEVKTAILDQDLDLQSIEKELTDIQWQQLGLKLGKLLLIRRRIKEYKAFRKAQARVSINSDSSGLGE